MKIAPLFKYSFAILMSIFLSYQTIAQSSLLPTEPIPFKINAKSAVSLESLDVENQPFKKAYRISTNGQNANDSYTLRYNIDSSVNKGDVLFLSFYRRSIQSKRETGESFMEIALDHFIDGKYNWPPIFERGMSFGSEWVLTQIPFVAAKNVTKGEMSLIIKCGKFPQIFELGGISLINYKQSKQLRNLPKSIVHYEGDSPGAVWRKAAAARIEKYRKGDLKIKVLDKNGKPISNAIVSVNLKKSAFAWGTAVSSDNILNTSDPNFQKYRDTLLRYFNKVVFENEMKAKNWNKFNLEKTQKAINWFKIYDIPIRGHVMVWPSWQHSPQLVQFKNDTVALRAAILKQIDEQTSTIKVQFAEWDVVNEPFAHHNIMDSLGGKKVMVDWFKAAKKNTNGVKLFLNEYTMFHSNGAGSDDFYNNVKFLKENGVKIDGIGEQGHIGGTPPGIEFVIKKLDHFAELGLPIQISEFDITSDDDDFKARYLKDFMTAIFSHPSTNGFLQWGFWEKAHWLPSSALWDKDWNPRKHGKVFTELVSKTWNTNEKGFTSKKGEYKTRGFNGDYEITVENKGNTVQKKYTLDSKGGILIFEL